MKVQLREITLYVQWRHYNNIGEIVNKTDNYIYSLKPTSSWTECIIKNAKTLEVERQGRAFLGKKEKNFNKDIGRRVALKHAISDFSKQDRKVFWEAYFKETNQKYRK